MKSAKSGKDNTKKKKQKRNNAMKVNKKPPCQVGVEIQIMVGQQKQDSNGLANQNLQKGSSNNKN
ncbi:MAG: hypothetical protein ACJ71P_06660 [Nitrososphaeraceae archaeon]